MFLHRLAPFYIRSLSVGANAKLVRYADNMVMLARDWTAELTDWVEARLQGKSGLEINREKTRVVEVKPDGGSRDFLGYTFRWDRDLRGRSHKYLTKTVSSAERADRLGCSFAAP